VLGTQPAGCTRSSLAPGLRPRPATQDRPGDAAGHRIYPPAGSSGSGNHIGRLLRALLIGRAGSPRAGPPGGWDRGAAGSPSRAGDEARLGEHRPAVPLCYTPGTAPGSTTSSGRCTPTTRLERTHERPGGQDCGGVSPLHVRQSGVGGVGNPRPATTASLQIGEPQEAVTPPLVIGSCEPGADNPPGVVQPGGGWISGIVHMSRRARRSARPGLSLQDGRSTPAPGDCARHVIGVIGGAPLCRWIRLPRHDRSSRPGPATLTPPPGTSFHGSAGQPAGPESAALALPVCFDQSLTTDGKSITSPIVEPAP
jgi:hypothetical protein